MIGPDVKQTGGSTCDTEHEYKHARVPRQRRKSETPAALYSQVLAGGPKRVAHEGCPEPEPSLDPPSNGAESIAPDAPVTLEPEPERPPRDAPPDSDNQAEESDEPVDVEEGPVHRPLIRAT